MRNVRMLAPTTGGLTQDAPCPEWKAANAGVDPTHGREAHSRLKGMPRRQTLRSLSPVVDPTEQAALRYLARRDRTEAQMKAYLVRLGASSTSIRNMIKRLVERG